MIFQSNFDFFKKNVPFSRLKSVHAEYEGGELETQSKEHCRLVDRLWPCGPGPRLDEASWGNAWAQLRFWPFSPLFFLY